MTLTMGTGSTVSQFRKKSVVPHICSATRKDVSLVYSIHRLFFIDLRNRTTMHALNTLCLTTRMLIR